jgi:hypothetical protein
VWNCVSGEEEWSTLFSQRAKVYRFDGAQWKERGVGEMKISKHNSKRKPCLFLSNLLFCMT